ncbi:hypothetical protein BHE74_00006581 [Ensete ventricosum]|nr:hypothetical protein BHE74_00006581 [Ensete ventricosum]
MEKPSPTTSYHSHTLTEPVVLLFNKAIFMGVILMNKISMGYRFQRHGDGDHYTEDKRLEELRGVFKGEEPSLKEVAEAFSILTMTVIGSEAMGSQRVLCKQGFPEGQHWRHADG